MQNSFSFEDAFRKIVQVNDDLLAGKIDVQTAAVHHAGSVALDKMLNTAIKVRLAELSSGKSIPAIGSTMIFQAPAIEDETHAQTTIVDASAVRSLANIATVDDKKEQNTRLPKIGVCGMSPNQAGAIASEIGELAELDFWHDDGQGRLKNMAGRCDIIFVNLGQVCHKTTQMLDALKANYVIPKTNGKTAMLEAIKDYFSRLNNEH